MYAYKIQITASYACLLTGEVATAIQGFYLILQCDVLASYVSYCIFFEYGTNDLSSSLETLPWLEVNAHIHR